MSPGHSAPATMDAHHARLLDVQGDSLRAALAPQLPAQAPYALVDFPFHSNVGDSAIWLGARRLLRTLAGRHPDYVASVHDFDPAALRRSCPDGPVFLLGGGNFGDLWPAHQDFRERLLASLGDRRVVQLPQSIHFDDARRAARCARAVAAHGRFTLFVRDEASLGWARAHLDCPASLVPDCAVALGVQEPPGATQRGVVLLLRDDIERAGMDPSPLLALPDSARADWIEAGRAKKRAWRAVALVAGLLSQRARLATFDAHARHHLRRGLALLGSRDAVVTDRLHGHLLAFLLGKPQVVLDNGNGKVHGYARIWTAGSSRVRLAESAAAAAAAVRSLDDGPRAQPPSATEATGSSLSTRPESTSR